MPREIWMATKQDIQRRKQWEDHILVCRLEDCNHCESHKWIKIQDVRDWVADNAEEGRQGKFYLNAQNLLDYLIK